MDAGRRDQLERKVYAGTRLDREDGLALAETDDLVWLGRLAQHRRAGAADGRATFVLARELVLAEVDEPATVVRRAATAIGDHHAELRLTGLVRAATDWDQHHRTLRELKAALPAATVRAFTAADILAGEQLTGRSADQLLAELADAGLDSLAADGPEFGDPTEGAGAWDEWSRIHRLAHAAGLPTSVVVSAGGALGGPGWIDHLLLLRDLQEATGGFLSLTPLRSDPTTSRTGPVGAQMLRTFALIRLLVDNIPHLTCDLAADGGPIAQLALNFGVDDLVGSSPAADQPPADQPAGASAAISEPPADPAAPDPAAPDPARVGPESADPVGPDRTALAALRDELVELIGDAGFRPVERDTRYRVLREYDAPPSLAERRSEPQRVWA